MKIANKGVFFDFRLFSMIIILIGVGLLAIYSVSYEVPGFNNFKRQFLFVFIGMIIFFGASKINYNLWKSYALLIYTFSLFLMTLVLFWGEEKHGTTGWLGYASYHVQPVEIMKAGIILILAKYFSTVEVNDKRFRHVLISGLYCLPAVFLAILQPDFGSAGALLVIWFIMTIIWGMKKKHLLILIASLIPLFFLTWITVFKSYQKARITTFLDPLEDPGGSGYHVLQSITAIGSGGIYGKGLGYGSQSQLHFIPEAHTDFIYSVVGEELGFIGSMILATAFFFLFLNLFNTAQKSADNFSRFIIGGIMAMFFIQFIINIGMNIGLVPVTGLPLPLVSYGGSALIMELFLLGIVFNINITNRKAESFR